MTDLKQIRGDALRQARRQAGLSARKLADRINDRTPGSDLTDNAIYAYENGRVLLGREIAERIVVVLKVPMGRLLAGDPDFADVDPNASLSGDPVPTGRRASQNAKTQRPVAHRDPRLITLHARFTEFLGTAHTLVKVLRAQGLGLSSPAPFKPLFDLLEQEARDFTQDTAVASAADQSTTAADGLLAARAAVEAFLTRAREGNRQMWDHARQHGQCDDAADQLLHALSGTDRTGKPGGENLLQKLADREGVLLQLAGLKPRFADDAGLQAEHRIAAAAVRAATLGG